MLPGIKKTVPYYPLNRDRCRTQFGEPVIASAFADRNDLPTTNCRQAIKPAPPRSTRRNPCPRTQSVTERDFASAKLGVGILIVCPIPGKSTFSKRSQQAYLGKTFGSERSSGSINPEPYRGQVDRRKASFLAGETPKKRHNCDPSQPHPFSR